MQSVTALAHLKSCVLYLIDPSEQCGYSVEEQIKLYNTLRPLFKNKPLLVVFSKADIRKVEELTSHKKSLIENWLQENNLKSISISTMANINVNECK